MDNNNADGGIDPTVIDEILQALQKLRYGEVIVTVHDARVVQIETRAKKRFAR